MGVMILCMLRYDPEAAIKANLGFQKRKEDTSNKDEPSFLWKHDCYFGEGERVIVLRYIAIP
jgi:hypothetical protein